MKEKDLRKMMKANGFEFERQNGSHRVYKKQGRNLIVSFNKNHPIHQNVILRNIKKVDRELATS